MRQAVYTLNVIRADVEYGAYSRAPSRRNKRRRLR